MATKNNRFECTIIIDAFCNRCDLHMKVNYGKNLHNAACPGCNTRVGIFYSRTNGKEPWSIIHAPEGNTLTEGGNARAAVPGMREGGPDTGRPPGLEASLPS